MLSYDNEGRLAGWQNTPTSPTTTDSFLYDGEGNRVEQQTTTNGSIITSTVYVAGGLEEITTSGATTTLTKYYGAAGLPTAERVGTNGPVSYLASDGQGTVSETLDGGGNVTSAQLYTPYGSVRYSSGSSPTSLGYTGQRADSTTGLDYYHARYYDPVAGQFTSADSVRDGLNRYGYVRGNPTTATDPSGHRLAIDGAGASGSRCLSLLDCGILAFGGNASVDKKHHIQVGDGQQMHIDPHNATSPKDATNVYRWCVNSDHCADAIGYSGKQLAALIKANQDHLANDQTWLKRIQDYIAEISFGAGVITAVVVAAAVFLLQLARAAATDVPPDVSEAISTGSEAGSWTAGGVGAALEATEHWLEADISKTQSKLAQENGAAKIGGTLWYVGATLGGTTTLGGWDSMGGYWVIDDGTVPGNAVKNAVVKVLDGECARDQGCW